MILVEYAPRRSGSKPNGIRAFATDPFATDPFGINPFGGGAKPFISTWDTDTDANNGTSSDVKTIVLPLTDVVFDIIVDWGDGTYSHIDKNNRVAEMEHDYGVACTPTIKIYGTLKGWSFNNVGDCLKITDISQWGCFDFSTQNAFYGAQLCSGSMKDAPIISATDLTGSFYGMTNLLTLGDLARWDLSAVTVLERFLSDCSNFNQDISVCDYGAVVNMTNMLTNAVAFSVANYSAFLIALGANHAIGAYTLSSVTPAYSLEAAAAHAKLVADGWTITDGGCELGTIVDWWRIEDGITNDDPGGTDQVSKWEGSINSIDLDDAGAARPIYTADQINGNAAIVFDGTAMYMQGAFGATYAQPNTIILVAKEPTSAGAFRPFIDGDHIDRRCMFGYRPADAIYRLYTGGAFYFSSTQALGTGYKIWSVTANAASSIIRVNGVDKSDAGNADTDALSGLTLGASQPLTFFGDTGITDVIVINGALTPTQFGIIETYLNALRGGIY